jgi:hypothetical protein
VPTPLAGASQPPVPHAAECHVRCGLARGFFHALRVRGKGTGCCG